jgi:hypothetical protein
LQLQELEAVKEVVKEHEPDGVNDIGLTEIGTWRERYNELGLTVLTISRSLMH